MRLITDTELSSRTDVELAVLFHMAAQALGHTAPGTQERQTVIASLQNISRERAQRHCQSRVPGF